MLKDKREIALQVLMELEKDAADHYRKSAEIVQDRRLAGLFRRLSLIHEKSGEDLGRTLAEMGYLAKEPDADRQIFSRLFTRLQAKMSENEGLNLLDQAVEVEENLGGNVESALKEDIPQATRRLLERLSGESTDIRRLLSHEKELAEGG